MNNIISVSVYLAMAVFLVICLMRCIAPVLNVKRMLRRAVRSLKAGEKSKRSWQEDNFLGRGALHPHWREYLNNLFFADGEYHNPSNVEDYINEETAIDGPGRAALSESAAGIFVSLGFLGTLLGISIGLGNFNISDTEGMMGSIRTLIPGMKYAFTTSIVGVCMSILFTLTLRLTEGSARHALLEFYAGMQKHAGVISVDPMTQIAIYQQEQNALIQAIADDVSGAMTSRIANSIDHAVKPLQKALEEFATMTAREQVRGIDMMVTRFIEQLDTVMDKQLTHLSQTIDATCRNQERMYSGLSTFIDELSGLTRDTLRAQELTDEMLTQFKSYLGKLNDSHKMVDDGYSRIAANVEHLELIARQQNTYLQTVGELQREAAQSLDNFRHASGRFMQSFDKNIETATSSLGRVADDMNKSSESLAKYQSMFVNGFNKDIDKLYNTYFALLQDAIGQLNQSIGDMNRTVDRMPMILDETADFYGAQSNRIADALYRAQAVLDELVDRLKSLGQ